MFEGKELLHFAPEPSLTAFIRSKGVKSYKTCDLFKPDVDLRIDICNIDLPDQSFDLVLMPPRFGARAGRSQGDVGAEADIAPGRYGDHHGSVGGRTRRNIREPVDCVRGRPIDPFWAGGSRSLLRSRPSRSAARSGVLDPRVGVERALRSQARVEAWGTSFPLHASSSEWHWPGIGPEKRMSRILG